MKRLLVALLAISAISPVSAASRSAKIPAELSGKWANLQSECSPNSTGAFELKGSNVSWRQEEVISCDIRQIKRTQDDTDQWRGEMACQAEGENTGTASVLFMKTKLEEKDLLVIAINGRQRGYKAFSQLFALSRCSE